jgi:hypothetical protein
MGSVDSFFAMLSPPLVAAPVTPCVRRVRVVNQLVGAEVRVFADGVLVGHLSHVDGPDVMVPLDAGVTLVPLSRLTATQSLAGESSEPSPERTEVLAAPSVPADLARVFTRAPLLVCGECLWLEGVIPGATVSAVFGGGAPVTLQADVAAVHVEVPGGLAPGVGVVVSQSACGIAGPPVLLPGPFAQALDTWPAPPPRVDEPIYPCQRTLHLRDMRGGATIVLRRGGADDRVCFGAAEGLFTYGSGLAAGESVELWQEFTGHRCELVGERGKVSVSNARPPAPGFPYPVCAGDVVVTVSGLIPGAVVDLLADGVVLCTASAPTPEARIGVPAGGLADAARIGARQRLCEGGPWSDTGSRAVTPLGPTTEPKIVEPLFECGTAVGVLGLAAGTVVWILSERWKGAIGLAIADGDFRVDVDLWFPLAAGDRVGVRTVRCGARNDWPWAASVKPRVVDLPAPQLADPADDCGGAVLVRGLVPGAIVDVEFLADAATPPATFGAVVGSARATTGEASVPVPGVEPGAVLRARQRMCAQQSGPSNRARLSFGEPLSYPALPAEQTFRICQLTGPSDPGSRPHPFNTEHVDLFGTDLGIPVEHAGTLWLFFGDCFEGHDSEIDGDPIAWTQDADLGPDGLAAPNLHWWLNDEGNFQRLVVDGLPKLGNFEVPTGGFSYDGTLYLFIAREKVDGAMRTSHLAGSSGGIPAQTPQYLYDVSSLVQPNFPAGPWLVHVSPTVVRNADWPGLPNASGDGVLVFGTSHYHESDVYLAWFPILSGMPPPHPATWSFFTGFGPGGAAWRTVGEMAAPGADFTAPIPLLGLGQADAALGELSVHYVPRMRRWLLTYAGGLCRVARAPWGPWSPPTTIFERADPTRDAGNSQPGGKFIGDVERFESGRKAGTYAPYTIGRWSRFDRSLRRLELVYTLSTEPAQDISGYQPQLMRTYLRC